MVPENLNSTDCTVDQVFTVFDLSEPWLPQGKGECKQHSQGNCETAVMKKQQLSCAVEQGILLH